MKTEGEAIFLTTHNWGRSAKFFSSPWATRLATSLPSRPELLPAFGTTNPGVKATHSATIPPNPRPNHRRRIVRGRH